MEDARRLTLFEDDTRKFDLRHLKSPGTQMADAAAQAGATRVAYLDEAGRGAWAGPLTVGAVCVEGGSADGNFDGAPPVRDSKQVQPRRRAELAAAVRGWAEHAVGWASAHEIDRYGLAAAQRLAASRAIDALGGIDAVCVDGPHDWTGRHNNLPAWCAIGGDNGETGIAAASLLAKTERDQALDELAEQLPWWAFDEHHGYPTLTHRRALAGYGPSSQHRTTWKWVANMWWSTPAARQSRTGDATATLF